MIFSQAFSYQWNYLFSPPKQFFFFFKVLKATFWDHFLTLITILADETILQCIKSSSVQV